MRCLPGVAGLVEEVGNEEMQSLGSASATDPMVPREMSEFTFLSSLLTAFQA